MKLPSGRALARPIWLVLRWIGLDIVRYEIVRPIDRPQGRRHRLLQRAQALPVRGDVRVVAPGNAADGPCTS